jgi:hypothetical protein
LTPLVKSSNVSVVNDRQDVRQRINTVARPKERLKW